MRASTRSSNSPPTGNKVYRAIRYRVIMIGVFSMTGLDGDGSSKEVKCKN